MEYLNFINNKHLLFTPVGFEPPEELNEYLFPFQADIVRWALRKGRACLFEDCGLGKTIQQLEWANQVCIFTNGSVLVVAPLAVSKQTICEGQKFGIDVNWAGNKNELIKGINITNYEKLHKFEGVEFEGVVLDESSIVKNFTGATRNQIMMQFRTVPYKLACTATPSPNDYMELGNHSEFLGIMTYSEMLSMFFVNDSGDTGQWRLKKHAEERKFWEWLCSWAVMLQNPGDLGYSTNGFILPELKYIEHLLPTKTHNYSNGLFVNLATDLNSRRVVRRETVQDRVDYASKLINKTDDQWIVWCGLNDESELLSKMINESVEVSGSTDYDLREQLLLGFGEGKVKRLITKPKIAGFGMNWQNCNRVMFVGLNDSWEQLYQAIRRVWRFGQKRSVEVHIVLEEREGSVLKNIQRKDQQATRMVENMVKHTKNILQYELNLKKKKIQQRLTLMKQPLWNKK